MTFLNRAGRMILLSVWLPAIAAVPSLDTQGLDAKWKAVMEPYLQRPLWTEAEAYDGSHNLLVPIHAAFGLNKKEWQQDLSSHYSRFVANAQALPRQDLARLQYLYVASCFAAEAAAHGQGNLIPQGLPRLLGQEFGEIWTSRPAWEWGRKPFQGMKARLIWKLGHPQTPYHYYQALIDQEFFELGIAANLKRLARLDISQTQIPKDEVADALSVADQIFRNEVVWHTDGGWLLQPGVWSDHPDYLYAGQPFKQLGMRPAPVADISWDSAHFTRFPAILYSLRGAYPKSDPRYKFYNRLLSGLEVQFFNHVAEPPSKAFPTWRFQNYMDGRNGVYRWQCDSLGPGQGYGPYEDSSAVTLGWWTFLGTERIRAMYANLDSHLGEELDVRVLYHGPRPLSKPVTASSLSPDSPDNRLRGFIVQLASLS